MTLTESGGANLNYAAEYLPMAVRPLPIRHECLRQGFHRYRSVHGNATAGGAYQPGLSDYVIAVRKQTEMLLAGPHYC